MDEDGKFAWVFAAFEPEAIGSMPADSLVWALG